MARSAAGSRPWHCACSAREPVAQPDAPVIVFRRIACAPSLQCRNRPRSDVVRDRRRTATGVTGRTGRNPQSPSHARRASAAAWWTGSSLRPRRTPWRRLRRRRPWPSDPSSSASLRPCCAAFQRGCGPLARTRSIPTWIRSRPPTPARRPAMPAAWSAIERMRQEHGTPGPSTFTAPRCSARAGISWLASPLLKASTPMERGTRTCRKSRQVRSQDGAWPALPAATTADLRCRPAFHRWIQRPATSRQRRIRAGLTALLPASR